jgi:hypothetical protein
MAETDFTKTNYARDFTQAKVAHSTLVSKGLNNHGTSCRRFSAVASATRGTAYLYHAEGWDGTYPVSARCLFRQELISTISIRPWVFVRASLDSGVIDETTYYAATFDDNYCYLYGNAEFADLLVGNSNDAAYGDISAGAPRYDDWTGLRLDAWTEADDVHLQVWCSLGHSVCDALDATGEPVWEKYIDCYHIDGSTSPTMLLGTASAGFGSTTVIKDGMCGFGVGVPSVGGATAMYVDSFRARRIR